MVKTFFIASTFSIVAFTIGYHVGFAKCDNNLRPDIKKLNERLKYLEAGKVKS